MRNVFSLVCVTPPYINNGNPLDISNQPLGYLKKGLNNWKIWDAWVINTCEIIMVELPGHTFHYHYNVNKMGESHSSNRALANTLSSQSIPSPS